MVDRRNIPSLSVIIALIAILSFSTLNYAQETSKQVRTAFFWGNIGFGISSNGAGGGLNLSIQPTRPGPLLLSLRGIITSEIVGTDVGDVAVLIGYSSKRPQSNGFVSVSAGIGYVSGTEIEGTVGFPVQFQLFYTPVSFAGFGIQGYANFNKAETFYGAMLCLQFGLLR